MDFSCSSTVKTLHFLTTDTTDSYHVFVQNNRLSLTKSLSARVNKKFADVNLKPQSGLRKLAVVFEGQVIHIFVDGERVAPPIDIMHVIFTGSVDLGVLGPGQAEFHNLVIGKVLP